jgi:hypothetical protein
VLAAAIIAGATAVWKVATQPGHHAGRALIARPAQRPPREGSAVPGDIEAGDILRARHVGGNAGFTARLVSPIGSNVRMGFRLYDPGPGNLQHVRLRVFVSNERKSSFDVIGTASAPNADPSSTSGMARIKVLDGIPACLYYVAGSAVLRTLDGRFVRQLPDGLTEGGIPVGDLMLPSADTRMVYFTLRLKDARGSPLCHPA